VLAFVPLFALLVSCNPAQIDAIRMVNETRAALGRPPLRVTDELTRKAQVVADELARTGQLVHSSDLSVGVSKPYSLLGENEGYGSTVAQIHEMLVASPDHFAIMIDPRYTEIGIGITIAADGTIYEVQEYKAP
jgi:uncharacterized protein YkwD